MPSKTLTRSVLAVGLVTVACAALACADTTFAPDASRTPSFATSAADQHTVVVNPNANGNAIAATIQEGIDMVEPGGKVQVKAGTYTEALIINKALTLEAIGDGSEPVVIASPTGLPNATVQIATPDPVAIRNVTVLMSGVNGVLSNGIVDVTLEYVTMVAVAVPATGTNRLVRMVNNATQTGGRARLVVRQSFLDATFQSATLAISLNADIDAVIEDNVLRRTGGPCIFVQGPSPDGVHVDIVNNDLDQCHPAGRAAAIDIGPVAAPAGSIGMTGIVNIIGNKIRNSDQSCLPTTAIRYELYTGRIERNSIIDFVQPCAQPIVQALPAAIWVGSRRGLGYTPASPVVRFNDIQGNAQAGLRVAPNITTSLDARCNWWGSASGPSGVGTGTGDAVVVEAGGARPVLAPVATEPVANGGSCPLEFSLWSAPVSLGTTINTAASEQNPNLSPDELSLYFVSDRIGGAGGLDIWVSRRAAVTDPWGSPVNLGSVINSTGAESAPSMSADGRLLFFFSDYSSRPGAQGGQDLYVSRRADPTDDFAWGAPVNLGPNVNTTADEAGSSYVPASANGIATLYFNRRPIAVPVAPYDLYSVPITEDGLPSQLAAPITELNSPAGDFGPEVSSSGREVVFGTGRPGGVGGNDLWVSIRRSIHDPWSTPENLGTPINTTLNDRHPSLSSGDRTMFFASTRTGTLGSDDLWMSTRTRIGDEER